jgi:hypothetical protein
MEAGGYLLSPAARTVAINMATEENPGIIKQFVSQQIAAKGLSAKDQTYLTAMMPLLQAAGHDQSGARLSTSQIRQNIESMLPLGTSKEQLEQVHQNRQGFYIGALTQAGSAAQLPQYKGTLGADLAQAQGTHGQSALGSGQSININGFKVTRIRYLSNRRAGRIALSDRWAGRSGPLGCDCAGDGRASPAVVGPRRARKLGTHGFTGRCRGTVADFRHEQWAAIRGR